MERIKIKTWILILKYKNVMIFVYSDFKINKKEKGKRKRKERGRCFPISKHERQLSLYIYLFWSNSSLRYVMLFYLGSWGWITWCVFRFCKLYHIWFRCYYYWSRWWKLCWRYYRSLTTVDSCVWLDLGYSLGCSYDYEMRINK